MLGTVTFKVEIAPPDDPRYADLFQILEQNIEITAPDSFLNGQVGTVLPTTNVGVFLLMPGGNWYIWSDTLNQYVPQGGSNEVGQVAEFARSVIDANHWLECDGRALPREGQYVALFQAIGTVWGNGDGSSTFNIPDGRGKTIIGRGPGQMPNGSNPPINLTNRTLGDQVGEESHQLSAAELPAIDNTAATKPAGSGSAVGYSATSGGAHNNMQPSMALIRCIKWA